MIGKTTIHGVMRWIVTICCAVVVSVPASSVSGLRHQSVADVQSEDAREGEAKEGTEAKTLAASESRRRVEHPRRPRGMRLANPHQRPRDRVAAHPLRDGRSELESRFVPLRC